MAKFTLQRTDITTLAMDAIVNAANVSLLGGGGVDGAIHAMAGPSLLAECERLPEIEPGVRCPVGEARITGGYLLRARHVIHTVGPVWEDENPLGCDAALAACYRSCMTLAAQHRVRTIAFPCISTGAYSFPSARAAQVAVTAARQAVCSCPGIAEVVFVCFESRDFVAYTHMLRTT